MGGEWWSQTLKGVSRSECSSFFVFFLFSFFFRVWQILFWRLNIWRLYSASTIFRDRSSWVLYKHDWMAPTSAYKRWSSLIFVWMVGRGDDCLVLVRGGIQTWVHGWCGVVRCAWYVEFGVWKGGGVPAEVIDTSGNFGDSYQAL